MGARLNPGDCTGHGMNKQSCDAHLWGLTRCFSLLPSNTAGYREGRVFRRGPFKAVSWDDLHMTGSVSELV